MAATTGKGHLPADMPESRDQEPFDNRPGSRTRPGAIRETDMFELFSSQVENKKLIEELMERYVDEEGNALPLKKERNVSKPVADWRKLV